MDSRVKKLKKLLNDPQSVVNMDAMHALVSTLEVQEYQDQKNIKLFLDRYENVMKEIRELLTKPEDFDRVKILGEGTFGRVELVNHKVSGRVYAMKCLNKKKMLHSEGLWHERNIMAFNDSPWLVKLFSAFQDVHHLYIVMEFLPGGELSYMNNNFNLSEEKVRFYAAELVLAINALHSKGYIHRDIKSSNIMFDHRGHLKLIDYDIAMKMDEGGLVKYKSAAGTKSYMAPEVLDLQGTSNYLGKEVDWWSAGVCIFEMLVGYHPFLGRTETQTAEKVKFYKKYLKFPVFRKISKKAKELLYAFLTDKGKRLGRNGVEEIMQHPFFKNKKWTFETIRQIEAPVVPKLKSDTDTRYFRDIKKITPSLEMYTLPVTFEENYLPFIGFTYLEEEKSGDKQPTSNQQERAQLIYHKGHEFIACSYRFSTKCDQCSKRLSNFSKPPPALKCVKCHISCHRYHLENKETFVSCKGLQMQPQEGAVDK